jgi:RimJ/RimL family protein N-acetyltransferase
MGNILETKRLQLRELQQNDSVFILELLNSPKFVRFIGDRGVRTLEQAADLIENRYRASYRENGYGLYAVSLRPSGEETAAKPIGICGFVRRPSLPAPDLGFALLPKYEGAGFGYESAAAVLSYGADTLKFNRVLAITSLDNDASGRLLAKLGFVLEGEIESDGETLKLYSCDL